MSFVSFTFALFFAIVLVLRMVLDRTGSHRAWIAFLIGASLVFYAWNAPWHLLLLGGVAVVGYVAGRVIGAAPAGARRRRRAVVAAIVAGLGVLGFFKYVDYLAFQVAAIASAAGMPSIALPRLEPTLPLGISFYTFEMISYVVDVYRGRIAAERRFGRLLLFLAFFPHLVAGPIVRAGDFLYQIDRRRRPRLRVMQEGAYLVVRGFFLKVVVADNLATIVAENWGRALQPQGGAGLGMVVVVLFAFQILCDFDGYSTIARGTAYLLGFRLPVNFATPYVAGTFREFWQRWHITLSTWLRDYLYLPLGGNRMGTGFTYRNLFFVMALGGLWHGAANTFLVWGALHGAGLVIERALGLDRLSERGSRPARLLWWMAVQTTVLVAWVFFRSPSLGLAFLLLRNIVVEPFGTIDQSISFGRVALLLAVPIAEHVAALVPMRRREARLVPVTMRAAWAAVMLYAVCTAYGPSKTFIYFKF
jgi:alginate O-acetyltransferase complex protein AlgI